MTYADLLAILVLMTPEELNQDVTIFDTSDNEYFPAGKISIVNPDEDILDPGHYVIEI